MWSRFVTIVKQQHKLDEVSYHKLFDILKQYQNEVNELRAEKLARNANPLELVATAQASQDPFYQSSRSHRSQAPSPKPSIPSRSHTSTRHKGKEIAKPITSPSETTSEEDIDPNDDHSGQFGTQRTVNIAGTREKEQYDWLMDTDEEVDERELEAHYSYKAKIQEVPNADSGNDSELVEQNEKNDVESDDERVALASLIANIKLDVDENKKIQKQLKKANTTLAQELKECKAILAETSKSLGESISIRDSCLVALQTKQTEFKNELKKLIEKGKGKSMDTKFDKPSIVRQPNAQRIPKPSVLGKSTPFLDSLKRRYFPKINSVLKTNVSEGLSKPVTAQTFPQTARQAVSNTNVLKPGMYRIDNRTAHTRAPQLPQTVRNTNLRVYTSTGVNHKPTVSRPQLKSNQSRDKVLPNNSQVKVKKTQVEVYPRIPSVSNKMKFVTACKDNLNSRTLNANAVCATCNKCLVDSNHFACVAKMLSDVDAVKLLRC
nr:hypothetical protein [Tanacetum cinerariifolium]